MNPANKEARKAAAHLVLNMARIFDEACKANGQSYQEIAPVIENYMKVLGML